MDWCDKYPCYQNAQADPEGVDREMGRIWRVVWVGEEKGKAVASRAPREMNLTKLSIDELTSLLEHPNNWQRRMAQRVITERHDPQLVRKLHSGTKLEPGHRGATPATRLAAL
jgi:hypothetical protein